MFSLIRKWLFPEKKKGKLLSRFPPCMSMKMIPPLNINTKGTLFHLAQLCLLCNLLFFQLSKKTIQFLGSLGYNNRLRIFILPHSNFLLSQTYWFQTITQTILLKKTCASRSNLVYSICVRWVTWILQKTKLFCLIRPHIPVLFWMADALCFFLIFTYQIWRLGKFRKKVVHGIDLAYGFHQEDERRQCQVVRHPALEFVDGGQSDAGPLRHIFLCKPAAHPVILEMRAHQSGNFRCRIFI